MSIFIPLAVSSFLTTHFFLRFLANLFLFICRSLFLYLFSFIWFFVILPCLFILFRTPSSFFLFIFINVLFTCSFFRLPCFRYICYLFIYISIFISLFLTICFPFCFSFLNLMVFKNSSNMNLPCSKCKLPPDRRLLSTSVYVVALDSRTYFSTVGRPPSCVQEVGRVTRAIACLVAVIYVYCNEACSRLRMKTIRNILHAATRLLVVDIWTGLLYRPALWGGLVTGLLYRQALCFGYRLYRQAVCFG
jgi:hypothetical protein